MADRFGTKGLTQVVFVRVLNFELWAKVTLRCPFPYKQSGNEATTCAGLWGGMADDECLLDGVLDSLEDIGYFKILFT